MKNTLAILLIVMGFASPTMANILNDFTSDGCSKSPDGIWLKDSEVFLDCCVKHDIAYWRGGTSHNRLSADISLKICIEKKGYPKIAETYYRAVRLGGHPVFNTSYRWGYGWQEDRGYTPLSATDWQQILHKLLKAKNEGITLY